MKTRGFEIVEKSYYKDSDQAILPLRGTQYSAGYDFFSPKDLVIHPHMKQTIWTNIKAYMLKDEVLKIYVRSSSAIKEGMWLMNQVGIIDADYYSNIKNDGNIGICIYNSTDAAIVIKAGDRVAQGIFQKFLESDNCNSDVERQGGVGSTT